MDMNVMRVFLLPVLLVALIIPTLFLSQFVHCQCIRNPVVFTFGDSNSDTGAYFSGLGLSFGAPNGRAYFKQPSGRLCDGRLVIDFLCESLNIEYLTPYLEPLGPNFANGANFAYSGSTTLPRYRPFTLDIQVLQFLRFRARSPELFSKGYKGLVNEESFKYALHIIDIGQKDLAGSFDYLPSDQVIKNIPYFINEINYAIQGIYQHGGRNFWIHNTGPLGCLPQKLASIGKNVSNFDQHGCLQPLNDAAKEFNQQLRILCEELRSKLTDSTIVYVDIYSIKYDLIANSAAYGFENPLMACCGNGGPPYNYNSSVNCGRTGYNVCGEGSKYVSWDGVHYTEAANAIFASKILSMNYSTPPMKFNFFCSI